MTQNTHNPKFNSLKKHETLSKDFAINKKRKDASDFNRDNFELLKIDWSMSYDVKLPSPTTVVTSVFQSDSSLSDGKHACPMDPSDNLTFTRLPQSPGRPLAHIPNRTKPCLS